MHTFAPPALLVLLLFAWLGELGGRSASDDNSTLLTSSPSRYFVFPTLDDYYDDCPAGLWGLIRSETEEARFSCGTRPIFSNFGMVKREPPLMRAGPGVHPYLEYRTDGTLTFYVAVTVPAETPGRVVELVLVGDDVRLSVPLSDRTASILLAGSSGVTFASFNLTSELVPVDFLRAFFQATQRKVFYGPSGKKKIKIGKANAKNIENMLALYDASESLRQPGDE